MWHNWWELKMVRRWFQCMSGIHTLQTISAIFPIWNRTTTLNSQLTVQEVLLYKSSVTQIALHTISSLMMSGVLTPVSSHKSLHLLVSHIREKCIYTNRYETFVGQERRISHVPSHLNSVKLCLTLHHPVQRMRVASAVHHEQSVLGDVVTGVWLATHDGPAQRKNEAQKISLEKNLSATYFTLLYFLVLLIMYFLRFFCTINTAHSADLSSWDPFCNVLIPASNSSN